MIADPVRVGDAPEAAAASIADPVMGDAVLADPVLGDVTRAPAPGDEDFSTPPPVVDIPAPTFEAIDTDALATAEVLSSDPTQMDDDLAQLPDIETPDFESATTAALNDLADSAPVVVDPPELDDPTM
jgi:hypothetical protein